MNIINNLKYNNQYYYLSLQFCFVIFLEADFKLIKRNLFCYFVYLQVAS